MGEDFSDVVIFCLECDRGRAAAIYLLQGAPSDLKAIHTFYGGAHKSAFPCEKRAARDKSTFSATRVYPNDARALAKTGQCVECFSAVSLKCHIFRRAL